LGLVLLGISFIIQCFVDFLRRYEENVENN